MIGLLLAVLLQQSGPALPEQVGGAVAPPEVIVQPAPEYPHIFFKKDSIVVIDLVIDTEGLPQNVRVVKTGGEKFDEKAIQAVQKYRFKPALKEGKAVPVEIHVQVNFAVKRPA